MLLDLDKFRNVNSEHGREAGDVVLRDGAQRLKMGARGDDYRQPAGRRRIPLPADGDPRGEGSSG
jgi:GGDEF domain-containing protein